MNGCVIKDTPIAVDMWKTRDNPSAKLFFLTHLHGDHVVGLTSSWQHTIYCSEITAKLLLKNYGIKENLVKPLSIGQNHILYLDEEQLEQMVVTVLDANHCPGAVMFIFEAYFGKILYTGDFRYYDNFFEENSEKLVNIDDVYLDNTYCEEGCDFQSVKSATEEIFSIIRKHPDHDVIIGLRNLGKEELLLSIALELKEWISIPVKMNYTVSVLGYPDVFKVDDRTCRIRAVPLYTINKNYLEKLNESFKTIAIIPTALYTGLGFEPFSNSEDIYVVNYSNHSSFNELKEFVRLLAPRHVIPIVKGKSKGPFGMSFQNRANMRCFDGYLSNTQRINFTVPDSVKRMMSTRLSVQSTSVNQTQKRKKPVFVKKSSKLTSKGVVFEDDLNNKMEDKRRKVEDPDIWRYIEPASTEHIGLSDSDSVDDIFNNSDEVESWCNLSLEVASGDTATEDESEVHSSVNPGINNPGKGDNQIRDSYEEDIYLLGTESEINFKESEEKHKEEILDQTDAEYIVHDSCREVESGETVDKNVGQKRVNDCIIEKQNCDKNYGISYEIVDLEKEDSRTSQLNDKTTEVTDEEWAVNGDHSVSRMVKSESYKLIVRKSTAKQNGEHEVSFSVNEIEDVELTDSWIKEEIDIFEESVIKCCDNKINSKTHRQNCDRLVVNKATKMCSIALCYDGCDLSGKDIYETKSMQTKTKENKCKNVYKDKQNLLDISLNVIPNVRRQLSPSSKRQKLYNVFYKFLNFKS